MPELPEQSAAPRGAQESQRRVPPTAVRLLPVLVVVFGLNMLIDTTTDWPMLVRWVVSILGGIVAQYAVVRLWAARQR